MTRKKRDYMVGRSLGYRPQEIDCESCGKKYTLYLPQKQVPCRECAKLQRDYYDRLIEVGDTYFTGNPPKVGLVIKVTNSRITLDTGVDYRERNTTMQVKDGSKGICLNKLEKSDIGVPK